MRTPTMKLSALLVAPLTAVAMSGCAAPASLEVPRDPAALHAPAITEGVHAERIPLRTDDPKQVANVVEDVFQVNRRSANADVRAIFIEHRTKELVVVGTDRGIERVRALLSPGLIGAEPGAIGVAATPSRTAGAGEDGRAAVP